MDSLAFPVEEVIASCIRRQSSRLWNLSGGFLVYVLYRRFEFDSQTASANTNLSIDLVNHLRIAIMAKRKRAHDDLAIVTLALSSSTLKSILAPSTSEVLVPKIAAQTIIGRATTKQAPVEQAPIKSMPDMSIITKDNVPMNVDQHSIPRTKEQREHTAIMRMLRKCAKYKLRPGNKQCLSSHHGVTTTWSAAVEQASIEAPVKRGRGRPRGWMTNEERDRMMLL